MSNRTATNSIKIFNEWAIFAQNSCDRHSLLPLLKHHKLLAFEPYARTGHEGEEETGGDKTCETLYSTVYSCGILMITVKPHTFIRQFLYSD